MRLIRERRTQSKRESGTSREGGTFRSRNVLHVDDLVDYVSEEAAAQEDMPQLI